MIFDNKIFKLRPSQEILDLQQNVVDNLKPKQREKIKELRSRVQNLLKPTHNDFYLLKWLRARKFDVKAADEMLTNHLKWRKELRVDFISEEFEPSEVLLKYMPLGRAGEDKDGCNVFILPFGNLDVEGTAHCSQKSDIMKFYIYLLEYLDHALTEQSLKYKKLITTHILIFDLENFKLQDFIWKPAFDIFTMQLKLFEAHYPESLKRAFAINVPKVFQVFFGMIKPFLSDDTKKKIVVIGRDGWKEALLELIDPGQLPQHWGGTRVNESDGSPYWEVCMAGSIPKSYYKTLKMDPNKMKSATVPSKGTMKTRVEITEPGTIINWTFTTESHDIGFAISYIPDNNERNSNSNCREEVAVPFDRAHSDLVPEDGSFKCEETGIYTITFDNTYSWTRSKKLLYCIRLLTPGSAFTDVSLNIPE